MKKNRNLIPYFLTIIIFDIVYWLTMTIPNQALYLGYGQGWQEVLMNNKINLHRNIFIYGLTSVILVINLIEIFTAKNDKFLMRAAKSILTIAVTYLSAALIYKLLDVRILNLFYYYRGIPANIYVFATIFLTTIGLVILELIKRIFSIRLDKPTITKYMPLWMSKKRHYE